MRQHVIRYKCDSCHKTVEEPQNTGIPRGKMPTDWLHVDGYSNSHSVFKLDLCEKCKLVIMEITESA
jgi:hypothetical protein